MSVVKLENAIEFVTSHEASAHCNDQNKLVHIKMLAAPINPADINQIQGTYPLQSANWQVGGNEGVGVIAAIGPNVTGLQVGDRVIPKGGSIFPVGTWREQIISPDHLWQPISPEIPLTTAASLLVNPPTAYRLLKDFANLKPGDVIVQNGANSAVGRYIIQLAKEWGVKTVNIIRDRPGYTILEAELRGLGAEVIVKAEFFSQDEVQKYLIERVLEGKRPKLGFNCVGGLATVDMANFLADGGTVVTYGGMSKKSPVLGVSSLIFRDIKLVGFWMTRWYKLARQDPQLEVERQAMMQELGQMFAKEKLVAGHYNPIEFGEGDKVLKQALGYYSSGAAEGKLMARKPIFIFKAD